MKYEIVFVGGIWEKEYEKEIVANSKGSVQSAANVLQKNIIDGLDIVMGKPITIISSIFVGSFPILYSKLFIHSREFMHDSDKKKCDYQVGFVNMPIYKHISRYFHLKKYLNKVLNSSEETQQIYIGYSMTYAIVKSLIYVKRKNPRIKTCLIIPDLPEYMNLGKDKNVFWKWIKSKSNSKLYKMIKQIDSYVLLSKHMYTELKVNKPFTVIEGIAPNDFLIKYENNCKRSFVYTGSLGIKYGICDLVDAFMKLEEEDIELVICGAGDGKDYIVQKATIDPRIKFWGTVNNEMARKIQNSAFVLVNPRNSNEEYTKFSFPSKTMEYMMSGRPVLMYKLAGIPEEYDEHLYYIEDDLYTSLKKILNTSTNELETKGIKAKEFVMSNKNKIVQAEKIMKMIKQM